jgi:hypothetical protein
MGAMSPLKLTGPDAVGADSFFVCAAKVEAISKVRSDRRAMGRKIKRAVDEKYKPI